MIFVLPNLHSGCFTLFLDAKLQFNILNTNSFTLFILLDDHFIPSSFLIIFRIKMKMKNSLPNHNLNCQIHIGSIFWNKFTKDYLP